jgi:hypothetical protein
MPATLPPLLDSALRTRPLRTPHICLVGLANLLVRFWRDRMLYRYGHSHTDAVHAVRVA